MKSLHFASQFDQATEPYQPSEEDYAEYAEYLATLPEPEPTDEEVAEFCEPTPWPTGEEPPF